jgi:hypothetical protein
MTRLALEICETAVSQRSHGMVCYAESQARMGRKSAVNGNAVKRPNARTWKKLLACLKGAGKKRGSGQPGREFI